MKKYLLTVLFGLGIFCIHAQLDKKNDPVAIFDELWSEFDLRYANFELKKVDWNDIYNSYRTLVTQQTSNSELFEICCKMLQELNDGHVTMEGNEGQLEMDCGPPYEFRLLKEFSRIEDVNIFNKALESSLSGHKFGKPTKIFLTEDSNFEFRTSNSYGYLRMDEMMESSKLGKLKRALERAFISFRDKKGLIIDLRLNGGGWDVVSYKLAGRLVESEQIGHYKKTRKKGTNEFKGLKTWKLKPLGKNPFTKQVIILTSDFTASAAEVFLLAVMDLPNVTLVGDRTEGIFSDMYEFELRNGWDISLSHQQFYSREMINYEGEGITPDVEIRNTLSDALKGQDAVINRAMKILEKNTQ